MRSARSNTTTECPARVSCCAAASPAGPGADDRDLAAGAHRRHDRLDPALVPRPLDDLDLDLLDGDRVLADAEHARRLARRRAQPAGELGEVVGGVQALDRVAPVVAVDEVVPVGDEVAERAAVVAERDAAVHAAPGLQLRASRRGTARRPRASRAGAPAPAGGSASRDPTSGSRSSHPCARLHHLDVGLVLRQPEPLRLARRTASTRR